MAENLTLAKATLLATHLASDANLTALRAIVALHPTIFPAVQVLHIILLSLPETTDPSLYTSLIQDCISGQIYTSATTTVPSIDISSVADITENQAKKQLQSSGLIIPPQPTEPSQDILTPFLFARSRAIDEETGVVSLVDALLTPFIETSTEIYGWYTGTIQVLSKLIYDHQDLDGSYGLAQFEALDISSGIRILLSRSTPDTAVRDLEELVVPYIRTRRRGLKEEPWRWVFEWLVDRGRTRFDVVNAVVGEWDGPDAVGDREGDEDLIRTYGRAALTACYLCGDLTSKTLSGIRNVIRRVGEMARVDMNASLQTDAIDKMLNGITGHSGSFTMAELMLPTMVLTTPSLESLFFLELMGRSAEELLPYIKTITLSELASIRLRKSREEQMALLTGVLGAGNPIRRDDSEWRNIRKGMKALHSESRVLGEIPADELETKVLKALLSATKFGLVSEFYVARRKTPPLPKEVVEKAILDAVIFEFYDNATNGNKTRGNMKNAQSALAILYPVHSQSPAVTRAAKLIDATHALSHYSLTLTPGVPLRPVQIRTYADPPDLISRILQSNPKTYTQLDALLSIATDLIFGVSHVDTIAEEKKGKVDPMLSARITGMCVEAALAEDDFETAYSLILNRLIPKSTHSTLPNFSNNIQITHNTNSTKASPNDTAWRAAFQAGRYRPPHLYESTNTLSLRQLEMRMELLSHALLIAPSEAMMEILNTWKRCEDDLTELLAKESVEVEEHARKLDAGMGKMTWPGGFDSYVSSAANTVRGAAAAGSTVGMEGLGKGPMSLFAVAAEAGRVARNIGSTVVTNASGVAASAQRRSFEGDGERERLDGGIYGDGERTRKRDVLSGMVTSGLASGLGWVIGANPQPGDEH